VPDPELFAEWLVYGKSKSINTEPIDREKWDAEYSSIASVISKFVTSNRSALQGNYVEKVFASPRTWDMACRLWATCRCRDNIKPWDYLSGSIGEGTAKELMAYYIQMDLPDPRRVLERGVELIPNIKKIDRVYACLNSVMSFVLKHQEHAPRYCKILQDVKAEDVVAQCAKNIVLNNLCNSKEALELLESLDL
jgi:hypothetical protein